jgi:hypothetical protein
MNNSNWRPRLVGCVALLAMNPQERPVDALLDAVCRQSWVSPHQLVTTVLADVPVWRGQVESAILKRGDPKAAATFRSPKERFVSTDRPGRSGSRRSRALALGWRDGITAAFDEKSLPRSLVTDGTRR